MNINYNVPFKDLLNKEGNENLICIKYIRVSMELVDNDQYQYLFYLIHPNTSKMLHYFLLPMDCKAEDVLNKLKPFLLIHNDKYYTFVKKECFANPSFIHFFQKNEISFDFYNKENEIKLVTISSLYLKSISELHIKFNSVMKNNFIPNLFFFWNYSVVPVMMNLNMTPLISEEISLEIQTKKNLSFNSKFGTDIYKENTKLNDWHFIHFKMKNEDQSDCIILGLLNYKTNELQYFETFHSPFTELKAIEYFTEIHLNKNKKHMIYMNKRSNFSKHFYNSLIDHLDSQHHLYRDYLVQTMFNSEKEIVQYIHRNIVDFYLKEYLMNISIRKNLKTELQTLIKHGNLHVHTIIKDQIEIILSKKENDTTYFL